MDSIIARGREWLANEYLARFPEAQEPGRCDACGQLVHYVAPAPTETIGHFAHNPGAPAGCPNRGALAWDLEPYARAPRENLWLKDLAHNNPVFRREIQVVFERACNGRFNFERELTARLKRATTRELWWTQDLNTKNLPYLLLLLCDLVTTTTNGRYLRFRYQLRKGRKSATLRATPEAPHSFSAYLVDGHKLTLAPHLRFGNPVNLP